MSLKYDRISLADIGGAIIDCTNKQRAKLIIGLESDLEGQWPSVDIDVAISNADNSTLANLRQQALDIAIESLQVALEAVQGKSYKQLKDIQVANEKDFEERNNEKLRKSFGLED